MVMEMVHLSLIKASQEEIAALLSKLLNKTAPTNPNNINDISGSWAEEAIKGLSNSGILKGGTDASFKPNAKATRSESLLMIMRLLNVSLGGSLDIE
ncbi:S-layer homology domain-containing protein [Paenibacillus sp. DS2015]|uniref:S-layer homology domain-containing protein n=1 Tax=Paenibacillus sp. DS2015 TaxID=3373917 RepID=UPI003D25BB96